MVIGRLLSYREGNGSGVYISQGGLPNGHLEYYLG